MGLATAQLLASRGATISLADLNEEGLKAATQSLKDSDKHIYTVLDVRKSQSVNSWIETTVQKLGKLDGAVNMAGIIANATPVAEVKDEDWDFTFAVNTRGVFFCIRAELGAMANGGSIVSGPVLRNMQFPPAHQTEKGLGGKCIWTDGCGWKFSLLRKQGSRHWTVEDCSKGESTCQD